MRIGESILVLLLSIPAFAYSFSVQKARPSELILPDNSKSLVSSTDSNIKTRTNIVFPGGGIFFYWKAGVIEYLREKGYNLNDPNVSLTGASAGALCATLTALDISFEKATSVALEKSREAQVWDRPLGLYGIWGDMVYDWLDDLISSNDLENLDKVNGKVNILITKFPSFEKEKVDTFTSKEDLIRANMASVHIPLFMNGKVITKFRDLPYIDGSFLSQIQDYNNDKSAVILDWKKDPVLRDRTLGDAVQALSEDGIWDLLESGRRFAVQMEKSGKFRKLE